jgi:hypothetical protein
MKKTALAVATVCLVVSVAPATLAHSTPNSAHTFRSKARPSKHVKPGQTIIVKGTGTKKSTTYDCVLIIEDKKRPTEEYADIASLQATVKSTASGKITCKQRFEPYAGKVAGKTRHCPTTAKDRKAGMTCGVGLGDAATMGKSSASLAKFTAK